MQESITPAIWLNAISCEARPYAVEDELDGQGREEDTEHAGKDVRPGLAEEAHDGG